MTYKAEKGEQIVWGFRCRRRWARGLWRWAYLSSTCALLGDREGLSAFAFCLSPGAGPRAATA
jgi:hypothetical protein